jgi:hypothetical protein
MVATGSLLCSKRGNGSGTFDCVANGVPRPEARELSGPVGWVFSAD